MTSSHARIISLLFLTLLLMMSNGCLGNRDWHYPPSSTGTYLEAKASKPIPAKVVVLPFEDLRGTTVREEYWKAAIPLSLSGETEYDRPEEAQKPEQVDVVRFDPCERFCGSYGVGTSRSRGVLLGDLCIGWEGPSR